MRNHQEDQDQSQRMHDERLSDRNRPSSFSKRNASNKQAKRVEEKKKENQKPLMVEFFNVLPRAWKGVVIGVFVGLIPLAAAVLLRPDWNILGILALVLFAAVGFFIGKSTEQKVVRGRR